MSDLRRLIEVIEGRSGGQILGLKIKFEVLGVILKPREQIESLES